MLDTSTCCIQYSSTKVNILSDFKSSFNSSSRIANCPPNRPQNLISDQSQFFFRDALYLVDHDLGGRGDHQGQKARVSVQIRKAALIKEILFRWPIGRHLGTFQVRFQWFLPFREAPLKQRSPLIGHCANSDCFPLHSNGHSGALYFRTDLSNCHLPFELQTSDQSYHTIDVLILFILKCTIVFLSKYAHF